MKIKNYKTNVFYIFVVLLALSLLGCDDGDDVLVVCNDCDDDDIPIIECEGEVYTAPFYVITVERDEYECGYLLFFDTGSPDHWHGGFFWTEDLPEEFREYLLPVMVTYCRTERRCGTYEILDIINVILNIKEDN